MGSIRLRFALLALLALFASACGAAGGGGDVEVASETASAGASDEASEEEGGSGDSGDDEGGNAISSLEEVQSATIQIVAEGGFYDFEQGSEASTAGAGSGFIISPDGIAVTNNHVVTGSALLQVFVGGEEDDAINARILGVSECSDLAVIDLEGDGYPYMDFYEGDITTGLEVYAAGFPLGDPEFTLTKGIVSKAQTSGETEWASVDEVIEHDAVINPGNSGGPLVSDEGEVVGINYAGSKATEQYFAITRDEASEVLETLEGGEDVTSIGVNGTAFVLEDGQSGIAVSSVKSGSPADTAGIKGGDIITELEGLPLGDDGTMQDYCDVLRSRDATDTMAVDIFRIPTEEVYEGQINGRPLELTFSFAAELADETTNVDDAEGGEAVPDEGASYSEYTQISDDTGAIKVEVPQEWSDVNGNALDGVFPALAASTDLAALNGGWDAPGVIVAKADIADGDPDELLNEFDQSEDCTSTGREDYDDGLYTGKFEVWESCGGTDTSILTIVAQPEDKAFAVFVLVQIVTDADLDATDKIIETFQAT